MIDPLDVAAAFQAAWDAHDLDATLALVTDDCVFESARPGVNGPRIVGRDALRAAWAAGFAKGGEPFAIEDRFAAGDRVVQLWRFGAVRGIDVLRVRDSRISEKLGYVKAPREPAKDHRQG
jgi:ketosteroid isomerase-like protein